MFNSDKPSSIELSSLSSFRHELQALQAKIDTCAHSEELELYKSAYTYLKKRVDGIASRL